MTLDRYISGCRKGGSWETEFKLCLQSYHRLHTVALHYSFPESVSFQMKWSWTNIFCAFPNMFQSGFLISTFTVCHPAPTCFNAVNTWYGHSGFVCVCITLFANATFCSITCIEVEYFISSASCLGLECHFILIFKHIQDHLHLKWYACKSPSG